MRYENAGLGRRPGLADELGHPQLIPGRVLAQHRGRWLVATLGEASAGPRLLGARGRLRENPPVTGDWVAIDSGAAITAVLRRHGTLVRQAAGESTAAQILAANVDLALVVESLPEPGERRAERLLALALGSGVPAAPVLTKADLAEEGQESAARLARRIGVADAVAVSALEGSGLGILRTLLAPGTTTALLGRSGVGKSTLVNALLGEDRQATQAVRAGDGRGLAHDGRPRADPAARRRADRRHPRARRRGRTSAPRWPCRSRRTSPCRGSRDRRSAGPGPPRSAVGAPGGLSADIRWRSGVRTPRSMSETSRRPVTRRRRRRSRVAARAADVVNAT